MICFCGVGSSGGRKRDRGAEMDRLKISKLGLILVVVHWLILITFFYLGHLNFTSGIGLTVIKIMDIPSIYIAAFLSYFLYRNYAVSFFNDIIALTLIFSSLQWYFIGWLISKVKNIFFKKGVV